MYQLDLNNLSITVFGQSIPLQAPTLIIPPFNYTVATNNVRKTVAYKGYEFNKTTMIDVVQTKIIVKTDIQGRAGGSVKELISMGDYKVSLKGFLFGDNVEQSIKKEIEAFNLLCSINASIPIECELLTKMNIFNLVIENANLSQITGYPNILAFTIEALSDDGEIVSILHL